MKNLYLIFLRKLLLFTLVLAVVGYGITLLLPKAYITPTLPYLYLFFFAATLVVHYILLKVSSKKTPGFVNFFMLVTFGKLIFFLTIILIYAFLNREDSVPFIFAFFILYMFFTAFEVTLSLSHSKVSGKLDKTKQKSEQEKKTIESNLD
jgi:hypothetical protein